MTELWPRYGFRVLLHVGRMHPRKIGGSFRDTSGMCLFQDKAFEGGENVVRSLVGRSVAKRS